MPMYSFYNYSVSRNDMINGFNDMIIEFGSPIPSANGGDNKL